MLVARFCRGGVRDDDKAVLNVLEGDFRLVLCVFSCVSDVLVDLRRERRLDRLFRRAAVLEVAGVVVVLEKVHVVVEAERELHLELVLRSVRAVAAFGLGCVLHDWRERRIARNLAHIIRDTVLVVELVLLAGFLVEEPERDARVDDRLLFENRQEEFERDVDVGEHLEVRAPVLVGAGLLVIERLLFEAADVFALLEVEVVLEAVLVDRDVHELGGILGGAAAEAVQAEAELIVLAYGVVLVFAARVKLAVYELPVVAALFFVPVHRAAATVVANAY